MRDAAALLIGVDIFFSKVKFTNVPAGTFVILDRPKRHMGTKNKTIELQGKIKWAIAELGWSQNQLARNIYTETYAVDDDVEILNFQERLKKELQRDTTKPERLMRYLSIISSHPDAEKLDPCVNRHVPLGFVSENLSEGMRVISEDADKASKK